MSTEDLWDLGLDTLDKVAVDLYHQSKTTEVSFIGKRTAGSTTLELQLDVVKHIIEVKMKEAEDRRAAAARAEQRQRIAEILEKRKEEDLLQLSTEDLQKMLEN